MNVHVGTEDTQSPENDTWAIDRALADLFAVREQLYDPDLACDDIANNALVDQEHAALQTVALAKARTFEALVEKIGLLSSELARAPVSRPVRLLAASISSDVQDLMNA